MELYQLCSILEKISRVEDVRPILKQFISNNKVNFNKAAQVTRQIVPSGRPNSEPSRESPNQSPSPKNGPVKVKQLFTQDQRKQTEKLGNQNDSHTTDERNVGPNMMANTWVPNSKNIEDQFKKFTMMNQYKKRGTRKFSKIILSNLLYLKELKSVNFTFYFQAT